MAQSAGDGTGTPTPQEIVASPTVFTLYVQQYSAFTHYNYIQSTDHGLNAHTPASPQKKLPNHPKQIHTRSSATAEKQRVSCPYEGGG